MIIISSCTACGHNWWTGPVGKIENSENIKFLKIPINQISKGQRKEQLSEKVCCWRVVFQNTVSNCSKSVKVCFCSWFLKPFNCIQTILWTNSNRLKHSCVLRVRIRTCWNVAYREFFNANRWQSMSCDHFCVIIDWSSIGRCQSMPIN